MAVSIKVIVPLSIHTMEAVVAVSPGRGKRREKHAFSTEEDARLTQLVEEHGERAWHDIEAMMPERSARQCRERWKLYLSPDVVNGSWTQEEDVALIRFYQAVGPKWTIIAKQFPKRTANNVKNRQKQLQRRIMRMNRLKPLEGVRMQLEAGAVATSQPAQ